MNNDLISRQQAIDALYRVHEYNGRSVEAVKQLPSVQPEPSQVARDIARIVENEQDMRILPKRGKWIRDGHHIRCDQCGMYMCDTDREGDRIPTEFCPNCGADMREVTT